MDRDWVNDKSIPYITIVAFIIGSVFSLGSILWTVSTTKENPLSEDELNEIKKLPKGLGATLKEIVDAIKEMPLTMKQLAFVKLFQWYAMFCYWQYIVLSVSKTLFHTTTEKSALREATLINGQIGGFYNFIAFVSAFILVRFTNRYGPKVVHAVCLTLAGIGMITLPFIQDRVLLFVPMLGIGVAWASMMGNPYVMLAGCIPAHRTGVYMGIFNMFIVIPMMIQIFTLPLFYNSWLGGNPENVIRLAGSFLLVAAVAVLFVKLENINSSTEIKAGGMH